MSYEERKKQKIKRKKLSNIIVISVFVLLLAKSAYGIIVKNPKTILPEDDVYIVSMKAESVIIKDEKVYDIDGGIELDQEIVEGKRVSKGQLIGKANIFNEIYSLNEELKELDKAITLLNKKNQGADVFANDRETLQSSREELINEIQSKINENDYSGISKLKNQILFYDEKLSDVSIDDTLLGQSLESLNSRRDTIINEISKNSINYHTLEAGVISFEIDGYEKIFIPKEFENYTYEKIQSPDSILKNNDSSKEEDMFLEQYKIINNFNWYIAIKIDNIKDLDSYEIGDSIIIKIDNNDRELVGRIVAINVSNGKAVYVVEFNSYLSDYYTLRFPTIEILLRKQEAYKIPTKLIINNNGQKGVYIKEFNGIVRFRPIEILGEQGDYTYISKGNVNNYINMNSEHSVKTITLYDEILVNPWSFDEGDILN